MLIATFINGEAVAINAPPMKPLIDVLREDLALTGSKVACQVGVCGVCTVLLDGAPISACLVPVAQVDGRHVVTIEGLSGDALTALQIAFIAHGGFQCGICTPGQLVAATALLEESPTPSAGEIKEWMMGNLCRCTGYYAIIESIEAASEATVANARDDTSV